MYDKKFNYARSTNDSTPRVLVTSENQHEIRGFNIHYMTPEQIGSVRKEWSKVKNQVWSTATKERVTIRRSGVDSAFRTYKRKFVS